jgi:nucleotide-binding universal stress UspA family protein
MRYANILIATDGSELAGEAVKHGIALAMRISARLAAVRQWLHRCRSEPSTFRYIFLSPAVLLRIDFPAEAEAVAFARQFGGRIT